MTAKKSTKKTPARKPSKAPAKATTKTATMAKKAKLKATAAADQENARLRDERAARGDGMTASERAMAKSAKRGKATKVEKKLSAIDAAAQVLAGSKEPMNAKQMIEAMAAQGLWTSPGGKTPHATLYSAILREISTKGKEARFVKTERGKFTAKN